ncbi:MAG: glycosyltransferase family 2 protein [Deltaproteobacteria bacterium]|nr:glycosyltransferase family 2 protein [Deltaproteobacteria bacterium]
MGGAYPFAPAVSEAGVAGRVSVVVVHYSGTDDLIACAASVLAEAGDVELIVVDNASPDRGAALLPSDARLRRIWLPRNVGFAAGANAGVTASTGDVVVLLNPDATLRPGCLGALEQALASADIAVPRVLLADDPSRLDSCGHDLYPDGLNWCRGRGEPAADQFDSAEDVLLFSGAAVAFRRAALARVGALDEGFWAYGEDADLGLRAARAGLLARTAPDAVCLHKVGGSFGRFGLRKAFLVERNRVRVALVHLPISWLLLAPLWTTARVVGMGLAGAAGHGVVGSYGRGTRTLLPAAVLAAWGASVVQAPGSLARRMALGLRGVDASYGRRLRAARIGLPTLLRRPSLPQRSRARTT